MLDFLKSKKNKAPQDVEPKASPEENKSWFKRLTQGLKRTRGNLVDRLTTLVLGKKEIDAALFEELETILLTADVGVETTTRILTEMTAQVKRQSLSDSEALATALQKELLAILKQ